MRGIRDNYVMYNALSSSVNGTCDNDTITTSSEGNVAIRDTIRHELTKAAISNYHMNVINATITALCV